MITQDFESPPIGFAYSNNCATAAPAPFEATTVSKRFRLCRAGGDAASRARFHRCALVLLDGSWQGPCSCADAMRAQSRCVTAFRIVVEQI